MYRIACAQDENTVVYFDKSGNKHIRKGGNLSWRINNPALVKNHSHYARSNGSIGSCQGFAIFSYPEQGHKALSAWLHSKKYYSSTVQVIAEHYDPKNADAFATKLSISISVPLDKKLKSFTNIEFQKLLKAIEKSCGYELIGNEEASILPKITAKIENGVVEDTYLIGTDLVLSKKEAIVWVKANRLDAVIVRHKNGSEHLRSRPSHCIWSVQIPEEVIPPTLGEIETLVRTVGEKKSGQCIWGFINGILNSKEGALESAGLISDYANGEEVLSLPNDSLLLGVKDAGVCISLKIGIDTPLVSWATKFLRYLLALSQKDDARPPVIVFAHSQGAIISEHALKLLNIDERQKIRIFTFGGGSFLEVDSCHSDSHNYASENDLVSSMGSPYFRSLAVHRYLGMKEGLSQEAIIKRWALDDALLYLDSVDAHVFESFMKQRISHYESLMKKISNITILDPDPNCYVEHQFCRECYQKEVKKLIEKYKGPSLAAKIEEKEEELLYV
jgi:hypothetical protein